MHKEMAKFDPLVVSHMTERLIEPEHLAATMPSAA